jgi:hypothetical protein
VVPIPVVVPSKAWVLHPHAFWDCGFEYVREHERLSLGTVVCCQVVISETGRFLVQRDSTRRACVCR